MKIADFVYKIAIVLLLLGIAFGARAGENHQEKNYRVVMVLPRPEGIVEKAFRDYFSRHGIGLDTSVIIFSGRNEDQPTLINRLRELKPELIYTWGTSTTLAVAGRYDANQIEQRRYIRDIPIVFASIADPVAAKLVQSLDRPGRNITGASHLAPLETQLKTIAAYRPFRSLGYLYNPKEPNSLLMREKLADQARRDGFALHAVAVPLSDSQEPDISAIPRLIGQLKRQGAEFLYMGPDTLIGQTHRDLVTQAALENGLPSFSAIESPVRNSKALFGLFSPQSNVGRFAASKALKVLEHSSPVGSIPIETLQQFSLLINMDVARSLELYPPLMLLNVADVASESPLQRAIKTLALH